MKTELKEIRKDLLKTLNKAGSGHTAGPLGMTEIFYELYFNFLNVNPKKPKDPNRDYLILSNGHICPILYVTLAHKGFFKKEELFTLRKLGSRLQGHPQREHLPGLETTSGPLGSGLSQSCGIALALKNDSKKNKVVCLTSDGEHGEGNTWEAVLFAKKYNLKIINIIDRNFIQIDGNTEDVLPLGSLKEKYESFGWQAVEIDGNDLSQIKKALKKASMANGPFVIVANTTPGKGVSFMENNYKWHGKTPSDEELKLALEELK